MEHPSLKQSAYGIIKEKLLKGEIPQGERIREDMLAEEISMSRTPVREAINQLTAEGLVNNIPRKGIYPIELNDNKIKELLDVREVLETLSVVRCIERITQEGVEALKGILEEFGLMLSRGNYTECNELDSRFHREIAVISGNGKLIEFLSEIEDFMQIARSIEKKTFAEDKNRITLREHRKIFDCIIKKDKDGAVNAVKENIARMKKNMGI
jgi:GntR family transcriptional regulator, rspAB operon transcriptional repressor